MDKIKHLRLSKQEPYNCRFIVPLYDYYIITTSTGKAQPVGLFIRASFPKCDNSTLQMIQRPRANTCSGQSNHPPPLARPPGPKVPNTSNPPQRRNQQRLGPQVPLPPLHPGAPGKATEKLQPRDSLVKYGCSDPTPNSAWEALSEEEKYAQYLESQEMIKKLRKKTRRLEKDKKAFESQKQEAALSEREKAEREEIENQRIERERKEKENRERTEVIQQVTVLADKIIQHEKKEKVLQQRLDRYKNRLELFTCKICMSKKISILFAPCNHFVSCTECSKTLLQCPVCRSRIQSKTKVYI